MMTAQLMKFDDDIANDRGVHEYRLKFTQDIIRHKLTVLCFRARQ